MCQCQSYCQCQCQCTCTRDDENLVTGEIIAGIYFLCFAVAGICMAWSLFVNGYFDMSMYYRDSEQALATSEADGRDQRNEEVKVAVIKGREGSDEVSNSRQ